MGCSASKSPGRDDAGAHGDTIPSVPAAKIPRSSVDPLKESYDALEQLGTGGFSVVRRVRHRATGEAYAMKIIDIKEDEPSATDDAAAASNKEKMSASEIATEIDILRVLKSPTVLRLHEVFHYASHVYVVTEVLSGGAVLEAILRMKDERYTEAEAKVVIQRTLRGIDYMHKNFVLHRDLKLENLLLRSTDDLASVVIRILDWQDAARIRQGRGRCRTHAGWIPLRWVHRCLPRLRLSSNDHMVRPSTCGRSASLRTSCSRGQCREACGRAH